MTDTVENTTEPLLLLEDLQVTIAQRKSQVTPLAGVTLDLHQGETLGLVGESGSGKTMTALTVMGLLPAHGRVTGGRMLFGGADLVTAPPDQVRRLRGTRIGMIFQDPMTSLNPTMRIGDQVGEPLVVHERMSRRAAREAAIEVMAKVGMPRPERIADDYPHQMSGGMRQRAMIAMALVCRPRLLIADEPTTALDVTTQRQILDLIDEMKEEFRTSVILVTHDLGVVAGRADRVAVMYSGRVMESAPSSGLFSSPQHQYTRALLAALPERATDRRDRLYSIPGSPPDLAAPVQGCPFIPRCPRADDACREVQQPIPVGAGHVAACAHPGGGDPDVTPAGADGARADLAAAGEVVVDVEHVSKEYDALGGTLIRRRVGTVSAVHDVSLRVRAGETFGLVGESGCGKSTLGRVIAGLEPPSSGRITLAGQSTDHVDGRQRKAWFKAVQLMFQDSAAAMDPRMRIEEILIEPVDIQDTVPARERGSYARDLVGKVGLGANTLGRYPHEFSGGQLQRIGLARSMALSPGVIVCDEPVSALDVSVQAQVLNLMRDLQQTLRLSYIFISHDLAVVRYMADRIAVMYVGKIVEMGPADQVTQDPIHPYTRVLLDAIPTLEPKDEGATTLQAPGQTPNAMDPPTGCRFRTRCPLAQEICATTPPRVTVSPAGVGEFEEHWADCHFPLRRGRTEDAR